MLIICNPLFILRLSIISYTWSRDSHGLYDYYEYNNSSSNIIREDFFTCAMRYLIRKEDGKVKMLTEEELKTEVSSLDSFLFKVMPSETTPGNFIIESCAKTGEDDPQDKLWLVVDSLKENGKDKVRTKGD